MPAGKSTARPYNRDEKKLAKVKKKLSNRTNNASINKLDGKKSNAKQAKGNFILMDTEASNSASSYMRALGAALDKEEAATLRKLIAKAKKKVGK